MAPGAAARLGIVLNDQTHRLTARDMLDVLTPDGSKDRLCPSMVTFHIRDFVLRDYVFDPHSNARELVEALNALRATTSSLLNNLIRKDLPYKSFLVAAQYCKPVGTSVEDLSHFYTDSAPGIAALVRSSKLHTAALGLSAHMVCRNDPIHFRYVASESTLGNDVRSYLWPLEAAAQRPSYQINPLSLAEELLEVYLVDNSLLERQFARLFLSHREAQFQLFSQMSENRLLRGLIRLIKYTIEYPHVKLLDKLSHIGLPLEGSPVTPRQLYDLLVKIGVYSADTNPVLSSEVYGRMKASSGAKMVVSSLRELKPYHKIQCVSISTKGDGLAPKFGGKSPEPVPAAAAAAAAAPAPASTEDCFSNKQQNQPGLMGGNSPIYRISPKLAFSFHPVSMYQFQFNFFLPLLSMNLENWMLANPINYERLLEDPVGAIGRSEVQLRNQLPLPPVFKNRTYKERSYLKVSFTWDYTQAESLTNPDVAVSFDHFKHTRPLWSNASNEDYQARAALDKLQDLLAQKRKARDQVGMLDTAEFGESQADLAVATKRMLDEFLAIYCEKNKVPVIRRASEISPLESKDYRQSRRLKIFKWYSNSYETFKGAGELDATNYISCLKYLNPTRVGVSGTAERAMAPLGLSKYASFTEWDYFETHANNLQLVRHLKGERPWKMTAIERKIEQNGGSFLQMKHRLKRYHVLKKLERVVKETLQKSPSSDALTLLRCIVIDPATESDVGGTITRRLSKAYCLDLDLIVDIEVDGGTSLMVGDRLICSNIVELDAVDGTLCIR